MIIQQEAVYKIGSKKGLTKQQLIQLTKVFAQPSTATTGVLAGRAAVSSLMLDDIGVVVVKQYTRGGLIRAINHNTYLKTANFRCEDEFITLTKLHEQGINVPEPIAYGVKGNLLYNCWLVTQKIGSGKTLVETSKESGQPLSTLMNQVITEIGKLIQNNIHHVDLHPGNVIVDNDKIYLIDFDKAKTVSCSVDELWNKYKNRWQRALEKYNLSPELSLKKPSLSPWQD